jgi:cytochrome c
LLLAALAAWSTGAAPATPDTLRRGEQLYGRCLGCHAIEQHRTGPAHCGLFGRRAGSAPGFGHYSAALAQSGIVWDAATLDRFLAAPMAAVPGTSMTYLGVTDPRERRDLIAWLQQATQPGRSCRLRE